MSTFLQGIAKVVYGASQDSFKLARSPRRGRKAVTGSESPESPRTASPVSKQYRSTHPPRGGGSPPVTFEKQRLNAKESNVRPSKRHPSHRQSNSSAPNSPANAALPWTCTRLRRGERSRHAAVILLADSVARVGCCVVVQAIRWLLENKIIQTAEDIFKTDFSDGSMPPLHSQVACFASRWQPVRAIPPLHEA